MAIWQWALLALALLWAFQSFGVWFQMRHYSDVMKGITTKYNDGFVGAGHVRGRFRKGVIVLIIVDRDLKIRRFLEMSGRTVFAKFIRREEFEDLPIRQFEESLEEQPFSPAVAEAVKHAVVQINNMTKQPVEPGLVGLKAAQA